MAVEALFDNRELVVASEAFDPAVLRWLLVAPSYAFDSAQQVLGDVAGGDRTAISTVLTGAVWTGSKTEGDFPWLNPSRHFGKGSHATTGAEGLCAGLVLFEDVGAQRLLAYYPWSIFYAESSRPMENLPVRAHRLLGLGSRVIAQRDLFRVDWPGPN